MRSRRRNTVPLNHLKLASSVGQAVCVALLACWVAAADGVVTVCTEEAFLAAVKGGGTIQFGCSGTIARSEPTRITRDTVIDAGTNAVTFRAQATNRIFMIDTGVSLTLKGVVVQGGSFVGRNGVDGAAGEVGGDGEAAFGGAVYSDGGTFNAVQTLFESNYVQGGSGGRGGDGDSLNSRGRAGGHGGVAGGGVIFASGGTVGLTNCLFADNAAFGGSGGAGGTANTNLLTARGGDGGDGGWGIGGAVYATTASSLYFEDCTFLRSVAGGAGGGLSGSGYSGRSPYAEPGTAGVGSGGAVQVDDSTLIVTRSTFQENFATGADAAPGLSGLDARSGQDASTGGAGSGGGVTIRGGFGRLTNSTFFANGSLGGDGGQGGDGGTADLAADGGDGGAGGDAMGGALLAQAEAEVLVVNSTLSLNEATGGQGGEGGAPGSSLHDRGSSGDPGRSLGGAVGNGHANLTLINTLLDESVSGGNAFGVIVDEGNNLSSDGTPVFTEASSANDVDPRVDWLADNGGLTFTAALKVESPAIDQGDDSHAPATDQRGFARVGPSDIGAFEFGAGLLSIPLGIRCPEDSVILSWPAVSYGNRLQSSPSLIEPEWTDLGEGVLEGDSYIFTTTEISGPVVYYRLVQ